jgi:hypothetical protein
MKMQSEGYNGLGRTQRRAMIKRWKDSGTELSLKAWAAQQDKVGDGAQVWLMTKRQGPDKKPRRIQISDRGPRV